MLNYHVEVHRLELSWPISFSILNLWPADLDFGLFWFAFKELQLTAYTNICMLIKQRRLLHFLHFLQNCPTGLDPSLEQVLE